MRPLAAILVRDMRIAVRVGGGALIGVLFFVVVVTLIPFAVGPDLALLKRIGPAILWLAALLSSLLALDRLFTMDHEDGSLDLILMGRAPLELVVLVKGIAHWLTTGLPLIIAAPLIGLLLNLDAPAGAALVLTLLVGPQFPGRDLGHRRLAGGRQARDRDQEHPRTYRVVGVANGIPAAAVTRGHAFGGSSGRTLYPRSLGGS